MKTITLDAQVIEAIAGHYDEALRLIEERFDVRLAARGNDVTVSARNGEAGDRVSEVANLLEQLSELHDNGVRLGREDLRTAVALKSRQPDASLVDHFVEARIEASSKKTIVPKSSNQRSYINAIRRNDLVFGIGPAGTGKTYLSVAMAASLLNRKKIRRIILTRPAVEAGERLGFLPGDIAAKVDPYLRPLYDALFDMLDSQTVEKYLEQGVIEVAPLAFMRGRTLDQSFMILDEAQNATPEQMKMFLTRLGSGSKAVVNGDITQIDLPVSRVSGLVQAAGVVDGVSGIAVVRFDQEDVVRHPLVQRIILAYAEHDLRVEAARSQAAAEAPDNGAGAEE